MNVDVTICISMLVSAMKVPVALRAARQEGQESFSDEGSVTLIKGGKNDNKE